MKLLPIATLGSITKELKLITALEEILEVKIGGLIIAGILATTES